MRGFAILAITFLGSCAPVPLAEPPSRAATMADTLPPMKSFAGSTANAPTRANADMVKDFLDLSFRMESGRSIPVMTRFEGPITVRVTGQTPPSLVPDLRALLARLRTEAGIDVAMTGAADASITIESVSRAELQRAVPRAACFVVPRISSWAEFKVARRTPQVDWATLTRRDRAVIFVPADVAPQEIRDCLHEELAQSLGPLNDLYRLSDSVFNDDNINAVLTGFDMLMLRAYYAPDLRNGMTRGEVAVRLPGILARLNPAGEGRAANPRNDTTRDWIDAIEAALSADANPQARRNAAERAVNLTRAHRYTGAREGFAYYVYGRMQIGNDADLALQSFRAADRAYRASPATRIHTAHIAVQLCAFALSAGDIDATLRLTAEAIPIATDYQNAALLATLLMFRAEALDMAGRGAEASAASLDSLAWARYGYGADRNVRARQTEVAALNRSTGL